MKATEFFKVEHDVFQKELDVLESALRGDRTHPVVALKAMVATIAAPLERHAANEEANLFPHLEPHLGKDEGPLAVMNYEHEQLRRTIGQLAALPDDESQRFQAEQLAINFVSILRQHIHKEDSVLFNLAEQFLEAETLHELGQKAVEQG